MECIWGACWLLGALPHAVLYNVIAPITKFVLHTVVRYRRRVVEDNLNNCFADRTPQERAEICSDFYTILSEIIISTMTLANRGSYKSVFPNAKSDMHPEGIIKMGEEIGDNSWVALTTHFGLWEYLVVWSHVLDQRLMAVYHPLQNVLFDELFKRFRRYKKVEPIASAETIRFTMKNGATYKGESYVLGLIADQNPPYLPGSNWYSFLGRDTIFFEGGEKIALRVGLPVYFGYQERVARGKYNFRLKMLWDGTESVEPTEITRRYVAELERIIREEPSMWLWSHKRWKAQRDRLPNGATAKIQQVK